MKTRSKLTVSLVLGLAMILSVFCAGVAFADGTVGGQATADASSFDSNGWYTQAAYNAAADKTNIVSTDPNVAYLGHHLPESLGGYTGIAIWANGKVVNNNQLSVADGISFEVGIQPTATPGDHSLRAIHFVDSASVSGYLDLKETNTVFGIYFSADGDKVQIYANGQQQTLADSTKEMATNPNIRTIWSGAANTAFNFVEVSFGAESVTVYVNSTLIAEVTAVNAASFTSGQAQLVFDAWGGGGSPWVFFGPFDPFTVIKSSQGSEPIMIAAMKEDITVQLTKPVTAVSVVNAAEETINLEAGVDYTTEGSVVTLKKEFFTGAAELKLNTVVTFTAEDQRTTTLGLTILYYNAPTSEQSGAYEAAGEVTEDVVFTVTYENANETYSLTANGAAVDSSNYTATWADGKITVTIKADYLNGLTQGAYTFALNTLAGSAEYVVYRKTMDNSWITMGNGTTSDGSAVTAVKNDNGTTTMNIGFLSNVYYSEKLDVTKTIYIQMDMNKVVSDPNPHGWVAIGLTNDITKAGSLSEGNTDDRMTFLYVHAKGEFQCLTIMPNAIFKPEYVNQNGPQLFALSFAEADENGDTVEGQTTKLYFNGELVFETTARNQADFANGAYLGMFSAIDVLNITTNTDPTSPAANTLGLNYDLGTNTDVTVPMYNTTAVTAVRYGAATLTSEQFAFDGTALTIKGSFLSTVVFDDIMEFVAVCDGGTEVRIPVKVNVTIDPENSFVAWMDETGAAFSDFAGQTVTQVIDTATSAPLTEEQYTFADGVLTIGKDYFTEKGTYGFAVVADDELAFAMVVNQTYSADGIANLLGETAASVTDGVLTVSGESSYLYKDLVDLTAGANYTLNITNLNGLYNSGLTGSVDAYVGLTFFDMFSGNTITIKIYRNSQSAGVSPTYVEVTLRSKDGGRVYYNSVAISDQTNFCNFEAIGEHNIKLAVDDKVLTVTIGNTPIYLDLGDTVMTHLQLGVIASADIDGNKNACTFAEAEAEQPGPGGDDEPTDPETPRGCNGGCGNTVTGSGVVLALALLALACTGVCIRSKKN